MRALARAARIRASNVADRSAPSSAGTHASSFTLSAAAAAGEQARIRSDRSSARRIDAPLTPRGRPELRPRSGDLVNRPVAAFGRRQAAALGGDRSALDAV